MTFIRLCRIPRNTEGVSNPEWEAPSACAWRYKRERLGNLASSFPLPFSCLVFTLLKFTWSPCQGGRDAAKIFIVLVQAWAARGSRCFLIRGKGAIYTGS